VSNQLANYYHYPQCAVKASSYPKENRRALVIERHNKRLITPEASQLKALVGDRSPQKE